MATEPGPKRIEDMDLLELQAHMAAKQYAGGSEDERIRIAVQIKLAQLQDKAAQELVRATEKLGNTTFRLVCATWGLVGATVLLVLAEVILKVLGNR